MQSHIRNLYNKFVPYEYRYQFYKFRHQEEISQLLNQVNIHEKGTFSLTGFKKTKTIFIHITKTAGTSVATSLYGMLPYHYTGVQYRVIFGKADFNNYYKFAFVRNPWSRLFSAYTYLKTGGWDESDRKWADKNFANVRNFDDFVYNWLNEETLKTHIHFKPQYEFLLDHKDRLLIDDIGYFENIQQDYLKFSSKVPGSSPLGHKNPTQRSSQTYQEIYSDRAKEKVAKLYAKDIELLGYSFDCVTRKKVENGRLINE
ncbi:sulfotransferase family 2 domain-containing protein [Reinekea marinisedimentorum]|uniref:Sulfotransferase family protein n=1 Tax=Reinekea marinisedimentorum TaxID=230495 RepID=A0A4R3I3A6_9GAMM|nr:sulfotransferase family 2 domain-containing protein [Reinekea marinisedimentorum]TCS40295.1 sulfotransferase family protein [Reinekea marinisedimentorum]